MQVKVKAKFVRIAPRKARLVANLVYGLEAREAQNQLRFLRKKAAGQILKLLNSALASAEHNFNIEKDNLYISKITVDEGPKFKRWQPRAFGRAAQILKKTSHITLVLDEIKGKEKKVSRLLKKEIEKKEAKEPKKIKKEKKEEKPKSGFWQRRKEKRRLGVLKRKGLSRLGEKIFRRKSMG